jgi:hypothetical protein
MKSHLDFEQTITNLNLASPGLPTPYPQHVCSCAGRRMYMATWIVQYLYLIIGIIGSIILAGESLKVGIHLF